MKLPRRRRPYSERVGLVAPAVFAPQFREFDAPTRAELWRVVYSEYSDLQRGWTNRLAEDAIRTLRVERYGGAVEESGHAHDQRVFERLKAEILSGEGVIVIEALEDAYHALVGVRDPVGMAPRDWRSGEVKPLTGADFTRSFERQINEVFSRRYVDHRMRGGFVTDVGQGFEADAVDAVLDGDGQFDVARDQFAEALQVLSDVQIDNKVEAVRRVILSLESAARTLTGERDLGKALRALGKRDADRFHPALIAGWVKLYGWSSDEGGIRHGDKTLAFVPYPLARWLVVSAAALLTYFEEYGATQDLAAPSLDGA